SASCSISLRNSFRLLCLSAAGGASSPAKRILFLGLLLSSSSLLSPPSSSSSSAISNSSSRGGRPCGQPGGVFFCWPPDFNIDVVDVSVEGALGVSSGISGKGISSMLTSCADLTASNCFTNSLRFASYSASSRFNSRYLSRSSFTYNSNNNKENGNTVDKTKITSRTTHVKSTETIPRFLQLS